MHGLREITRLSVSLIERGQKDGSFTSALKQEAIRSALLGAAEGMIRGRLMAAQPNKPVPFSELQSRAVFKALLSGPGRKNSGSVV